MTTAAARAATPQYPAEPDFLDRAREQRETLRVRSLQPRRRDRHKHECAACDHGIHRGDGIVVWYGRYRVHGACALCDACGEWIAPAEPASQHPSGFGRVHAVCAATTA